MSKLEELLQGVDVEWKAINDIIKVITAPCKVKKEIYKPIGKTPIIDQGKEYIAGYTDENFETVIADEYILFGDHSEHIKYVNFSFIQGADGLKILKIKKDFPKYIYYCFLNFYNKEYSYKRHWTNAKNTLIPIPCPDNPEKSLEIQQEIVRVLDELTSLTNQLTTELETERQNRKKQFEFFREQLFRFEEGEAEWKSLGDVTKKTKNIRWNDTNDIFRYIDLSSVDKEKRIVVDTSIISSKNAPSRAQKIVFEDDIIFATTRPTQMRVCFITEEFSNQIASTGFCVLRAIKDIILPKWIFHQLTSNSFKKYLEENQAGIAYPAISDSKIKEFKIPIPVLAEQERIVKLLDQFDATHTAIEEEISKEIKLRTQQYEYYREKLLSFPQN